MVSIFKPIRDEQEFRSAVQLGQTTESLHLDFKREMDKGPDAPMELATDIAAMANAWGGTLILGLGEGNSRTARGLRVASQIVGVHFEALRKRLIQAVNGYVHPPSIRYECNAIICDEAVLLAVNVSPDERLVAVWDGDKHVLFPVRTNEGNAYMSPTEILERSAISGRAGEIKLRRAAERSGVKRTVANDGIHLEDARVTIVSSMLHVQNGASATPSLKRQRPIVKLGLLAEQEFRLDITVSESLVESLSLPYGIVQEAWYSDASVRLILSRQLVRTGAFGWFVE